MRENSVSKDGKVEDFWRERMAYRDEAEYDNYKLCQMVDATNAQDGVKVHESVEH